MITCTAFCIELIHDARFMYAKIPWKCKILYNLCLNSSFLSPTAVVTVSLIHMQCAIWPLQRWEQCLCFLVRKFELLHCFETLFALGPERWFWRSTLCLWKGGRAGGQACWLLIQPGLLWFFMFYICSPTGDWVCKMVLQQQTTTYWFRNILDLTIPNLGTMKQIFISPSVVQNSMHFVSNTIHVISSLTFKIYWTRHGPTLHAYNPNLSTLCPLS